MSTTRPLIVHIDGPDGAGKTTACQQLQDILQPRFEVQLLAFPTSLPGEFEDIVDETYYYLSDFRREFTRRLVGSSPDIVILDRSFVSTVAYQGFRDINPPFPRDINGQDFASLIIEEGLSIYKGPYFEQAPRPVFCFFYADERDLAERLHGEDEVGKLAKGEQLERLRMLSQACRSVQSKLEEYVGTEPIYTIDAESSPQDITTRLRSIVRETMD